MAWYDFITGGNKSMGEKSNPAQYIISRDEGISVESREVVTNYRDAYEKLEVVNRSVNMITRW